MISAIWTLARLTWKRTLRGKTIWISSILFLVPLVIAGMTLVRIDDAMERWSIVCELANRSLVLLAPVLHLAPAIGEEHEGKTYTYLWSRPVPRAALILGKMTAIVPLITAVTLAAFLIAWLIVGLGPGRMELEWLLRSLGAAAAGIIGASCFAVGLGAMAPRHPLVVSLAYIFFAEQILPMVPSVQNVSVLYHVHHLARMGRSPIGLNEGFSEEPGTALIGLAVLSAVWLGFALWRVRRFEFGSADG